MVKDYYFYVFTKLASWDDMHAGEILPIAGPNEGLLVLPEEDEDAFDQNGDAAHESFDDESFVENSIDLVEHRETQGLIPMNFTTVGVLLILAIALRWLFVTSGTSGEQ